MKVILPLVAATAMVASVQAGAATTVCGAINPGGPVCAVNLTPAGPGAVASPFSFDVTGTGNFSVTFSFTNPFDAAKANASASFDFDPDVLTFTHADFSGTNGTMTTTHSTGLGSSVQVDLASLGGGLRYLNLFGTMNPNATPNGGNNFARVGGSLTLTNIASAAPEPTTWALFILGFGAIGATLRRRSSAVRVSKAKLNFV